MTLFDTKGSGQYQLNHAAMAVAGDRTVFTVDFGSNHVGKGGWRSLMLNPQWRSRDRAQYPPSMNKLMPLK
ncbi:hypothetical protein [Sulfuriferula plumbiphila]|uniref:hypothetical protein n=1 Tax=Sulfuriferula plumbiphila TaxID=171865 RepID=UPI0011BE79B2|nr:hypothetical protein [Sulfuriferula plumbiphila]